MAQHFTKLLLAIACLLVYSCKDNKDLEDQPTAEIVFNDSKMQDLIISEKFNYPTSFNVDLSLTTVDSAGKVAPQTLVYVIGHSSDGDAGQVYAGMTDATGKISTQVRMPAHFKEGIIRTEFGNSSLAHPVSFSPSLQENLTVNGSAIIHDLESRGQNCFPSVAGLFSSDGKTVGVSSSNGIEKVTLFFTNGTSEEIDNAANEIFFTSDKEICDNGIDDDGDGFVDCADPECGIETGNCSGSIPCVSSFFQIIGRSLKQLDPVTGSYSTVGTMPAGYTYNGGGYNEEDGYIYCTVKDNQTKEVFVGRIYGNGNITVLNEIENFEGRSYTGDMDGQGNLTNFYYKNGGWYMSKIDVSQSNLVLDVTAGAASDVVDPNFHDWVYNAKCDKFYALTAGGKELLEANHNLGSPTVQSIAAYNGLPSGAYGAAWADEDGHLYFSNNNTGNIYKVTMNNGCNPTGIAFYFQGASNSNNDGMSCPSAVVADFGGYDTDDDGIPDSNELDAFTNPLDACNPLNSVAACDGSINHGFVCTGSGNNTIAYVQCGFNCDAPDQYANIYNNSVDNDVDNDNVPNATDPNPTNSNETFVQYRPSQNSFGTYAFEDLWPETGDYDFNDMVVQVQERIITNNTSKVYKVIYDLKIMAMGGIFNNNLGIVTPDPGNKASIKVISAHNVQWTSAQYGDQEVIIIEKPKQMFYSLGIINAWNSDPYFQPLELQVEVELDGSYSYPSGYDSNIFIEQHSTDGHEIHIAGQAPTQNMKGGLFGTEKDDSNPSSNKYFLTENNLPWGIYIPTEWKYPQEGIDLTSAYIRFAEYAQSNPSLDWYTNTPANVVSSRVYNKH